MNCKPLALALRRLTVYSVALVISFAPAVALADVTGDGDVSPHILVPIGPPGNEVPTPVPDLPDDGGILMADLIVGGTAIPERYSDFGIVTIDDAAFTDPLQAPNVFIGHSVDGIGQLTVSGQFSELRVDMVLMVGNEGQGFLDITGGAVVTSDFMAPGTGEDSIVGRVGGSQGFVTVVGQASKWEHTELIVGMEGYGEVRVSNRGRLDTLENAIIGDQVNIAGNNSGLGTGFVEINGTGSRWDIGEDLIVGNEGRGELQVRNGGLTHVVDTMRIGNISGVTNVNSRGVVVVSDQNSELWAEDALFIGSAANPSAQGELYIRNGGRVRADGAVTVGYQDLVDLQSGDTAQSTLLASTLTNVGTLRGSGRIEVGTVTNEGDIRTAASVANLRERLVFTGAVNNSGNIESVGGEIEFRGPLVHSGSNADLVGIDAIFRFENGITTSNNARVFLDDTLIYILEGDSFSSNGLLALWAGNSTLVGDLTIAPANVLSVDLGMPSYGRLEVQGSAALDGVVQVSLNDDYLPQIGDAFEIIDAESRSGEFAMVTGGASGPGFWEASYTGSSAILTYVADVVSSLLADFDGNGVVNVGDLEIWRMNVGNMMATMEEGDADGDGDVDGRDLIIIQREFGMTAPATPASGAVPEPSGLALAGMSVAMLSLFRRKRS